MKKGFLLVIDGIDGAGKTTQIGLLSEYLKQKNIPFEVISFPRYGNNLYADLVQRYLRGDFGSLSEVNPYFVALAYGGDRFLAKPQIENWLNEGKLVIANRYVSASKAHLGGNSGEKKEEFIVWVDQLEYQSNGMPKEDLTILLNIDPSVGQENARQDNFKDIHEQSVGHLSEAKAIYLEMSQKEPNWQVVECMEGGNLKTVERINSQIIEILTPHLKKY